MSYADIRQIKELENDINEFKNSIKKVKQKDEKNEMIKTMEK